MCGIAGLSLEKEDKILQKKFLAAKKYLRHRGPDGYGVFANKTISLLHTRLSIIDLKLGKQPIENENVILIANGEIYNDTQIRKKYSNFNYKTNSDSESILAVYKNKGIFGFNELRGMYAFSIYDKKKNQLIISRDEFGIKPLYFSTCQGAIMFCSEISTLRKLLPQKKKIDNQKVVEHLQYQYCSGNKTIFKEILRVRPGETLVIEKGKIIKSTFKIIKVKRRILFNEIYFKKKILNTVSNHLRSDVPYCLFFSGGIDSMLLLYSIKELKKKNVTAFSIQFDGQGDKTLKKLCKNSGINLIEENFTEEDFWNNILCAAEKIDEPVADYAILPTLKLSEKASKYFKVVLTGEGGDELFGGYGRYKKMKRLIFKGSGLKKAFSDKFFEKWKNEEFDIQKKTLNFNLYNLSKLQSKQLFDYKNWLPNNLLVKLDRCLMANSLEGRTPLIDKELFKSFFFIDDDLKIKRGYGKYYVRKFLDKNLDGFDAFAPKKGFTVPIYNWIPKKIDNLRKCFKKLDFLNLFFDKNQIDELCSSVKSSKSSSKLIWHIIFFSSWYLIHIRGLKKRGNFFEVLNSINE